MIRLPAGALVVLIGVPGSGKSTFAATWFDAASIVSSDALRGVVGTSPGDQRASGDAFALLDQILAARLRRGLTTVIDSTGLEPERRAAYRAVARATARPCVVVYVEADAALCRKRNKARAADRRVPDAVLATMVAKLEALLPGLAHEGFDAVHVAAPLTVVPPDLVGAPAHAEAQSTAPVRLAFGLSVGRFGAADDAETSMANRLRAVAVAAEAVGMRSLWLMDHLRQIPQVGRAWDDLPDPWPTLGFLAALTERIRLGALVSPVSLRHPVLLARAVAALDVVSAGRAECGLGLGWFAAEHAAAGLAFPSVADRYAMLEDALDVLPLLFGAGSTSFRGHVITVKETAAYPRPVQARVPLLVGGSGPKRTLRLVAEKADACNLRGGPDDVRASLAALYAHCAAVGRDPAEIRVTHLSEVAVSTAHRRPGDHAGTIDELVGRYRALAEAGVDEAIVSIPGPLDADEVVALEPLVAAFALPRR